MFSNIGQKLMTYAVINTLAGIILGIVLIIISLRDTSYYGIYGVNWALFAGGIFSAFAVYIVSMSIYALGQITDDVHNMRDKGMAPLSENQEESFNNQVDDEELPEL